MPQPVFLSYARRTNRENARALRDALGAGVCFLDEQDLELGDTFPKDLTDALLACRVVVAFVDATYFQRWYCLREWMLARAPFDELVRRESRAADRDAALAHMVVVLAPDAGDDVVRRLPAPLQVRNWPAANATDAIAALVRSKLQSARESLQERCDRSGVPADRRSAMVDQAAMPPPRNLAGGPMHPKGLPPSLREGFVGRIDDLWRLHAALIEPRLGSLQLAALSGAVQGGGGFGKTRLALEYVHRFGPIDYRGGLFWIDASEAEPLESQLHGVLRELRPATPPIEAMREERRNVRVELESVLHEEAATRSMLFVLDNVPEPKAGTPPPPLDRWCPALGKVTCLATSRKRLDALGGIVSIDVDVLAPDDAVALLTRDVAGARGAPNDWESIAEWVGYLPLALTLINASLRAGATTPQELRRKASDASATVVLEEQLEALRDTVPDGALRGVSEAFALSYDLLDEPARALARKIAWLGPAPLPEVLLIALAEGAGNWKARTTLADRSLLVTAGASGSAGGRWQMHRLLADFLRTRSEAPMADCLHALTALRSALDGIDLDQPSSRALGAALAPHARAAATRVGLLAAEPAESSSAAWASVERIAGRLDDVASRAGERDTVLASVDIYRVALELAARDRAPLDWAATQNNLGNVLQALGEREEGTARLEEAVAAYRAALEVSTRDRAPLKWATMQNNLASALQALGEREEGPARLEEAVAAYRAALEVRTRDRAPLQWAITQNNLGNALQRLGEREEGPARLEEAVAAYRAALEVRTRDRAPLDWAMTQNNLGVVLQALGAREKGTARLEEAAAAYRAALEVRTRDRAPLDWATTQNNLGNVLARLGEREEGTARLEEAVAAYRAGLEVYTRDRAPLDWAMTQNNLGNVLARLGEREDGTARLEAVAAYRAALEVFARAGHARNAAITRRNLERAGALLLQRRSDG